MRLSKIGVLFFCSVLLVFVPAMVSAQAGPGISIDIAAGGAFGEDDYGDFNLFTGKVGAYFRVLPELAVGIELQAMSGDYKYDDDSKYGELYDELYEDYDITMGMGGIKLSAFYQFAQTGIIPYVGGGAGYYWTWYDLKYEDEWGDEHEIDDDARGNGVGLHAAVGLQYKWFFTEARYHNFTLTYEYTSETEQVNTYEFYVGARFDISGGEIVLAR